MSKFAGKLSDQELVEELLERGYSVLPRGGSALISVDYFEDSYSTHLRHEDVNWSRYVEDRLTANLVYQLKKERYEYVTFSSEPEERGGHPGTTYRASMRALVRQDRLGTQCDRSNLGVSSMQQSYVIGHVQSEVRKRRLQEELATSGFGTRGANLELVVRPSLAQPLGYGESLDSQVSQDQDIRAG